MKVPARADTFPDAYEETPKISNFQKRKLAPL
jgi:hypothetical protein